MMKLGLWCLLGVAAVPFDSCVDVGDPPEQATRSLAATPDETSAATPDETIALAVQCGDGDITYYDWRCVAEVSYFRGIPVTYYVWEFVEVGHVPTSCPAPHTGPLVGTTSQCAVHAEMACGGGSDDACNGGADCPLQYHRPTTACGGVTFP
jgi:hypothetical protein